MPTRPSADRRRTAGGFARVRRSRSGTRRSLEEILGDGRVDGVRLRDLATGESSTLPVAGIFVHVGRLPNTEFLEGVVALDEGGHVPTDIWMRDRAPGPVRRR